MPYQTISSTPLLNSIVYPPKAWMKPNEYLSELLFHPWYRHAHSLLADCSRFTHEFFTKREARFALVPMTTGSISSPMGKGSDSLPVEINIAGGRTFLADSMQFYLELALRMDPRPAYFLMSSFRGEESDARHLNQFYHAEVELVGGQADIIELAEAYVRHLVSALVEANAEAIETLAGTTAHISAFLDRKGPFPQLTFDEASTMLRHHEGAFELCDTGDLKITRAGERELIDRLSDFIWLTRMPASTVPFYQAVDPTNAARSLTGDMLAGIGEILGSGERARTAADVELNLNRGEISGTGYEWYLNMKQQTPLRTAGFGMGMERLLMWLTQTDDIRDWALIPRDAGGRGPL